MYACYEECIYPHSKLYLVMNNDLNREVKLIVNKLNHSLVQNNHFTY